MTTSAKAPSANSPSSVGLNDPWTSTTVGFGVAGPPTLGQR